MLAKISKKAGSVAVKHIEPFEPLTPVESGLGYRHYSKLSEIL